VEENQKKEDEECFRSNSRRMRWRMGRKDEYDKNRNFRATFSLFL
jgi:hypothetical protein